MLRPENDDPALRRHSAVAYNEVEPMLVHNSCKD